MKRSFLVNWLSREEFSLRGECSGELLDSLIAEEIVQVLPSPRGKDFDLVRLTEKGWEEKKRNRDNAFG